LPPAATGASEKEFAGQAAHVASDLAEKLPLLVPAGHACSGAQGA